MKECPECKRTYVDDAFTFCLADGSLLSAPYDPPRATIASASRDEPPTEIIPAHLLPKAPVEVPPLKRGRKVLIVGFICLLLGVLVVGALRSPERSPAVVSQTDPSSSAIPSSSPLAKTSVMPANTPVDKPSAASTATPAISPTETVRAYYDAANRRDITEAKRLLSRASLALMERGAKKQGKSLDQAMNDSMAAQPRSAITPTYSNEKITGDTATVDVYSDGQSVSLPLVKEDGEWKIAMDKFLEQFGVGNK